MKKQLKIKAILFLLAACNIMLAQTQPSGAEMQAMMQNMMPGITQQKMAESAGNWTATMTMWMDPTQPPLKTTAKVINEMIMDGRFLCSKYKGEMMGMPFDGLSTLTLDNGTQKYYSTWVDNMSTGMTQLVGKMSTDFSTIEMNGITQDPMSGMEIKMRQIITFVDSKTQKMTMYMNSNGKEVKSMEILLTKNE